MSQTNKPAKTTKVEPESGPRYRLDDDAPLHYIEGRMLEGGDEITTNDIPSKWMTPLNPEAEKKAKEAKAIKEKKAADKAERKAAAQKLQTAIAGLKQ